MSACYHIFNIIGHEGYLIYQIYWHTRTRSAGYLIYNITDNQGIQEQTFIFHAFF